MKVYLKLAYECVDSIDVLRAEKMVPDMSTIKFKMMALTEINRNWPRALSYVFTLWGEAVSWTSLKEICVADPTMEIEYMIAGEVSNKDVWFKFFLGEWEVIILRFLKLSRCTGITQVQVINCENPLFTSRQAYRG